MLICAACRQTLDDDSRFCGYCGFRVAPIPVEEHHRLSESIPPLNEAPSGGPEPARRGHGINEAPPLSLTRSKRAIRPQPVQELPCDVLEELPTEDIATSATVPPIAPPTTPEVSTEQGGQRRYERFPLRVEVGFGSEHNFYTGFLENLSGGGLFVATHQVAAIGDQLEVTFTVPGLQRICTALCRVRWVRDFNALLPEMVPGMGLQFSQLEADARAAIELFIRHREPIFYDD